MYLEFAKVVSNVWEAKTVTQFLFDFVLACYFFLIRFLAVNYGPAQISRWVGKEEGDAT